MLPHQTAAWKTPKKMLKENEIKLVTKTFSRALSKAYYIHDIFKIALMG